MAMKRTKKVIKYHNREGRPVIHTTVAGRKYIMVRAPKGKGVRRLYEGSLYKTNGEKKRLVLE